MAHAPARFALAALAAASPLALSQSAPSVPVYFFGEWTIASDCTEQHAGPGGHVQPGLHFRVSADSVSGDGQRYTFEALDSKDASWSDGWPLLQLEYRAGAPMTSVPADFECIPGEESASPFLAMSGYSISAEPWYEYEHWYGLVQIHGEAHHALIFPRNIAGNDSAIIVLHDADASDGIQLDHDGTIRGNNR